MPIYHKRPSAEAYGLSAGVLVLEAWESHVPGDMSNASSYGYPVTYKTVPGATVERTTTGDPTLEAAFVESARELESRGVRCITSNCGFMVRFQAAVADTVDVPVGLSSLIQLPLVAASLGGRPIGIITALSHRLGDDLLARSGLRAETPIVVTGLQDGPEFIGVLEGRGALDSDRLEGEMVEAAERLLDMEPDLGAIVLECALLPAYAKAVQDATDLPVFDFLTLANYLQSGVQRTAYEGAY